MTPHEFAPFAFAIAGAFFFAGRAYERRSAKRYSEAAERIRQKYQSSLSRTGCPSKTSKQ